jgi:ribosome-binding protein aMBF1 (putative translation factor)
MNHQDWTPVVLTKGGSKGGTNKNKSVQGMTQAQADIIRLENDEPVKRNVDKIKEFAHRLQQTRLAKKMNQKQFATLMCVKLDVIQGIESGKLLPDANTIQSIKRKLEHVKLEHN